MLNSNKIFATELSKFSEKVVKQNQILLYRVFLMVCLWINRHPSVSTSPLTNAFLYSILFFIHKGISIFCKILFPLTAPFDTKKSTALVLVDITIRVFWLGRFFITEVILKSFLMRLEIYIEYAMSLIELREITNCQLLLMPPSPNTIPNSSANSEEFLGILITFL